MFEPKENAPHVYRHQFVEHIGRILGNGGRCTLEAGIDEKHVQSTEFLDA